METAQAPALTKPLSSVAEQLDRLANQLSDLDSLIETYSLRLDPVLRPNEPMASEANGPDQPKKFQSGLADGLEGTNDRLAEQLNRMRRLLGRVDL